MAIYEQVCAEIISRNSTQHQLSLAAATGLGVLLSAYSIIQSNKLYIIYLAAAILLAILGLLNLENGREIGLAGQRRQDYEDLLLGESNKELGWERFRVIEKRGRFLVGAAIAARYAPTLGSSLCLAIFWFIKQMPNVGIWQAVPALIRVYWPAIFALISLYVITGILLRDTASHDGERRGSNA